MMRISSVDSSNSDDDMESNNHNYDNKDNTDTNRFAIDKKTDNDDKSDKNSQDGSKFSHLFVFSGANKAGMDTIDKEKQAKVIYEMSKDSDYFKRAAKQDEVNKERIKHMKSMIQNIDSHTCNVLQNESLRLSADIEMKRSFDRICSVLDMDMFYAAVEIRDKPHLKDLPVAVGGISMISTANYVARKYGVRAAMPGFIAKKLCPHLVFVDCNFDKYRIVAQQIRAVINEYDPDYHSHSLDEVYMDLTEAAQARVKLQSSVSSSKGLDEIVAHQDFISIETLRAAAVDVLQEIRSRIFQVTNGLTCSAGIANNFFLAKIGADVNKPNGQFELGPTREAVLDFVANLPTRKVGGVGKVTEQILSELGMKTMGDVRNNIHLLRHVCTPALGEFLHRVCLGIGENEGVKAVELVPEGAVSRKSLSCERTFGPINKPSDLLAKLDQICKSVGEQLVENNLRGRNITLKLKTVKFEIITRSITIGNYTNSWDIIRSHAIKLLEGLMPVRIRLMGVRIADFYGALEQIQAKADAGQRDITSFYSKVSQPSGSSSTPMKTSSEYAYSLNLDSSRANMTPNSSGSSSSSSSANCHNNQHSDSAVVKRLDEQRYRQETVSSQNSDDYLEGFQYDPMIPEDQAFVKTKNDVCDCKAIPSNQVGNFESDSEGRKRKFPRDPYDIQIQSESYTCPICANILASTSLEDFNHHIDSCLSMETINEYSSTNTTRQLALPAQKAKVNTKRDKRGSREKKKVNESASIKKYLKV